LAAGQSATNRADNRFMHLRPFLLDHWLSQHSNARFNLGGSTGPQWTLAELLQLEGGDAHQRLLDAKIVYGLSPGDTGLREAVAEMRGVSPEEVIIVAGGSEALLLVFYIAAESGTNVVVPFPGFTPYHVLPESFGVEVRTYHMRRENDFRIDLDEVRRLVDARTSILLVNSPHNPTGSTLTDTEMRALHDLAVERNVQFVADEVFHPIYHGPEAASAAQLPHTTVIGDCSKAFALSGLRIGWIIERDPERREQYVNAREYFSISNTTVGEFFAEIAVRHRDRILERTSEVATLNLGRLATVIAANVDLLDWVRPQGGMTAFVRLRGTADARPFCEAAAARGLLLTPGDCFGVPDHIRVGFGVGSDWFPHAMTELGASLALRLRSQQAAGV
jgi:aspartate/methionine/tyrosine aminotransferase